MIYSFTSLTNSAFHYIFKTNKILNNYIHPGMRKKEFSMAASDILSNDNLLIMPDHTSLSYSGRIDFINPTAPCFIYAGSSVHFRFHGTGIKIIIRNYHSYYDNYIGYVIDATIQGKVKLDLSDTVSILTIAEGLDACEHDVLLFKRQDAAHYFDFLGLQLDKGAIILTAPHTPTRRMECFGQ
jgi:hypothetical protein